MKQIPTTDFATAYFDGTTLRRIVTCKNGIDYLELIDYPTSVTQELVFKNGKAIAYFSESDGVETPIAL